MISFLMYIFVICAILFFLSIFIKLTFGICKCSKHLVGKVAIVTGSNSGIGYETAKDFAERGARVILACRNEERGTKAKLDIIEATGNKDVHYYKLDLSSFKSVREFVKKFNENEKRLDILVNNAGDCDIDPIKTEDGLILSMQVNYFGPFLLTNLLLPKLKSSAPSRIVNVASLAHRMITLDVQNLNTGGEGYWQRLVTYAKAKLCLIIMSVELGKQLEGSGVAVYALCPGFVSTKILIVRNFMWRYFWALMAYLFGKDGRQGAQTQIYLSVSPEVIDSSGCFYRDCKKYNLSAHATDPVLAKKLWKTTESLVKLN